MHSARKLDSLTSFFSRLISAVDPVATLAIFQALRVIQKKHPDVFSSVLRMGRGSGYATGEKTPNVGGCPAIHVGLRRIDIE